MKRRTHLDLGDLLGTGALALAHELCGPAAETPLPRRRLQDLGRGDPGREGIEHRSRMNTATSGQDLAKALPAHRGIHHSVCLSAGTGTQS